METGGVMSFSRLAYLQAIVAVSLWLAGCACDQDFSLRYHYYWGHYQSVIYDMYNRPEKNSPERLASLLEEDEIKAASLNKPLPPGFHAQLGYLYEQSGRTDLARKEYELEKQQFPESAVFMDRLLGYSAKK
jgi:hypothetical protein